MNCMNPVEIGERLKKQRLLLGYSRESMAEKADITPRFYYDLELGLKKMSITTLYQLSSVLNLSTDYILFGNRETSDIYISADALLRSCPPDKLPHLEQIMSHYIEAVTNKNE